MDELKKQILIYLYDANSYGFIEFIDILVLRKNQEILRFVTDHSTPLSEIKEALFEMKKELMVETDSEDRIQITKCKITFKGIERIEVEH